MSRTVRIRRKQPRPDGSVKLSEHIDGYRGYDKVDEVLAFIEGTDPSKKNEKELVKRTKKKSGSSADQGNGSSKKDVENARAHAGALNLQYIGPPPKSLPFIGPQPRQKKTSVIRNSRENVKTDDEKRDSSDRSASPKVDVRTENFIGKIEIEDNGDEAFAKRLQDEEYMMAKMELEPPPEKDTFVIVSNKKQKPASKGFVRVWTSSKAKRAATSPPSAPAKGSVVVKANVGRQRRNSFDYSPRIPITTSSSLTIALNRDSGPAVQYVGLNMANSNTSLNLSMFFDEEDARKIAHERMARSTTTASQSVMDNLKKISVTKYQPGTDRCGYEGSAEIGGKPVRKQVVAEEEKIRFMSEFVKKEWEQFKRGTTAEIYYEPKN